MATTALTPAASAYRSSLYEWVATTDHKKIGILYIANSFLFFLIAGLLAMGVRTELAFPGLQFVRDEGVYNQLFTMHGTVMIFLFIIPILAGFANYVVPLQLGAPDMAFPRINALSFWLLPVGGLMILSGYLFGGAAAEGWTGYTPLSSAYAPGPGTDLWLIGLILVGTASILGSVNFIATIFKMRAPGMTLFGYRAFVFATIGIGLLSFSVWAHHMFTTGVVFLPFFSFMTALIAVPTGVKMFNWIATLFRGSISLTTPMLFALGFISMFLIGGISGVMLAEPPIDFHLQDTYFVVAHLHYVFFGGSVMGVFAALYYWFPKMFGRRLNETLGKTHFWLMLIGFNLAFFPMHMLGIQGMPRRIADYSPDAGWTLLNIISTVGAFTIAISILPLMLNVVATFINGERVGDDPWEGNTLEWATSSPPPPYNFDTLPPIRSERPVFDLRHKHDRDQLTPPVAAGEAEATS